MIIKIIIRLMNDLRRIFTIFKTHDDACAVENGMVNEISNENHQTLNEKLNWFQRFVERLTMS